jgi:hypothetical protein
LADPWRPRESMGHSQSRFKSSMIAAPVKKHRFIKYYHLAREEGLTPKTIKSGWRASGIYPMEPAKRTPVVSSQNQSHNQPAKPTKPKP